MINLFAFASRRHVFSWLVVGLLIGRMDAVVLAEPMKSPLSRVERPVAIRGSVLMLPLGSQKPGDQWPPTLDITLADKRIIAGQVAWLESATPPTERQWTDDPRSLNIRPVRPTDDSTVADLADGFGPYLLAELPADVDGELILGRQKIRPHWSDVPTSAAPKAEELAMLERTRAVDLPDPDSPFEYWRWVLMAQRLHQAAPPPPGDQVQSLAARHFSDLWRVGLHRLADLSAPLAEECLDLLTRTATDQHVRIAAWLANPQQTNALLARLIDPASNGSTLVANVSAWLDEQNLLYLWPISEAGDRVQMAALTARSEPLDVEFNWANSSDPPVSIRIEPGLLTRIEFDRRPAPRPRVGLPTPVEPPTQVLEVRVNQGRYQFSFGSRTIVARPPAVYFRPLSPPLTLGEIQMQLQRNMTEAHQTLAHIRRLGGRWEIFIECRRPANAGEVPSLDSGALTRVASLNDLRGVEAVSVLIGPDDAHGGAATWLVVPEFGWHHLVRGTSDGTLQVHRNSLADRWFCRIVLPDTWLPAQGKGPMHISVARTHFDLRQIESGPGATVPWRPTPARAAIDLSRWDDLPQPD